MNPQERSNARPFNPHVARAEADRLFQEAFVLDSTPVRASTVTLPIPSLKPVRHRRGDGGGVARVVRVVAGVMGAASGSVLAVSLMGIAGGM